MKKLKDESGFTLLEIIVALTIMVGITVSIFNFMQSSNKMSQSIVNFSDQHNMVLTTNQYIRATLANATYVSLVNAEEPEHYPESGYSYLYCGQKGGLTLLDGVTGEKTELYQSDKLDCKKLFVLFRPDKLQNLNISGDVIGANPVVDSQTISNYNNASLQNKGKFTGTHNDYTKPKAYGALTATIKLVTWSRDDDFKYNKLKYSTATANNTAAWCFKYINEQDTGFYTMYLDNVLHGKIPDNNTANISAADKFWSVADEFSSEITFHNTNYVFVQNAYVDATGSPEKLVLQGCDTIAVNGSEPATAVKPYIQAMPWYGMTLANGSQMNSSGGYHGNQAYRLRTNVMNYTRCVKFIRPEMGGGVVSAGTDVDIQNYTFAEEMRDSSKIVYKITFDAVNLGEAGSKVWNFDFPADVPNGKAITVESASNCTATAIGGKMIRYASIPESEIFAENGVKTCTVTISIERDPEPEVVTITPAPQMNGSDINGGFYKITVKNPSSSKQLHFKVKLEWECGLTETYEGYNWAPGETKEIENYSWVDQMNMITTMPFTDPTAGSNPTITWEVAEYS